MNVPAIFEVGGFIPVPEIIAIEFWGLQTPNLGGRGGRGGVGVGTVRKSVGEFL